MFFYRGTSNLPLVLNFHRGAARRHTRCEGCVTTHRASHVFASARHTKDVFRILISKPTRVQLHSYRLGASLRAKLDDNVSFCVFFFPPPLSVSLFLSLTFFLHFLAFAAASSARSLFSRYDAFVKDRLADRENRRYSPPVPFSAPPSASVSPLESAFIAGLRRIAPPGRYANERREWRTTLNTGRSLGNVCNIN